MTIGDTLAPSPSRFNAHEVRTSQAECRGFESRLPLQFPLWRVEAAALMSEELRRRLASPAAGSTEKDRARLRTHIERLRKQPRYED
jgi:hypothetical protein